MNRWFSTPPSPALLSAWPAALPCSFKPSSLPGPGRARAARLAGLVIWLMASSASAQSYLRQFPEQARRGTLEVTAPPVVQINGAPDRLSPGSRIRGIHNEMLMSGQLLGQQLVVNYVRNPQGQVHEVWVLSAAELKADRKDRPGSEPKTNFRFGSDPQPGAAADVPYNQLPKYKN